MSWDYGASPGGEPQQRSRPRGAPRSTPPRSNPPRSAAPRPGAPSGSSPQAIAPRTPVPPGGRRRRWPKVLLGLVVVAGLAAGGLLVWVRGQLEPGGPQNPVTFSIPVGATTTEVVDLLASAGVVRNAGVFSLYLRISGGGGFEAGNYNGLTTNQAAASIVDLLRAGPLPPEVARVTIPEGLWLPEIRERVLAAFPEMSPADWDAAVDTVRSRYQPDGATLEGLLFPATYEVALEDRANATKLVTQMVTTFDTVADEVGLADATATVNAATGLELTPYEVLTVASMVEAETRVEQERPQVARVIYNRLIEGMRLDIDATTLYAIGRRTDALTVDDLASQSPWNTRAVAGIPPSPINAPGRSAMAAALNPADGDWLYYVLVDPNGTHFFTRNYDDFLAAADDARARGVFK